jgi:hypothetical protein
MHTVIWATYLFQKRNYCFHDQSHMFHDRKQSVAQVEASRSGTICSTCSICYTQTELRFTYKNHLFFDWTTVLYPISQLLTLLDIRHESFLLSAHNLLKRLWAKCTQLKTFLTLSRTIFRELNYFHSLQPTWGRILGRNCYSQSPLPTDFTHTPEQKWFETNLLCKHCIWKLKFENSEDYDQKPQRNCTFMNPASGHGQYCSRALALFFPVIRSAKWVIFLTTGVTFLKDLFLPEQLF